MDRSLALSGRALVPLHREREENDKWKKFMWKFAKFSEEYWVSIKKNARCTFLIFVHSIYFYVITKISYTNSKKKVFEPHTKEIYFRHMIADLVFQVVVYILLLKFLINYLGQLNTIDWALLYLYLIAYIPFSVLRILSLVNFKTWTPMQQYNMNKPGLVFNIVASIIQIIVLVVVFYRYVPPKPESNVNNAAPDVD